MMLYYPDWDFPVYRGIVCAPPPTGAGMAQGGLQMFEKDLYRAFPATKSLWNACLSVIFDRINLHCGLVYCYRISGFAEFQHGEAEPVAEFSPGCSIGIY